MMLHLRDEPQTTQARPKTNRVEEFYVAAFRVPVGDGTFTEVIMRGIYGDNQMMFAPNHVEHRPNSLSYLISRCKQIEEEQGISWRLLKLDGEGIHELGTSPYKEHLN
ncbi:MAG: hypothetical protein ABUK14_04175 [Desulfobacteria bacterium]